MAQVDYQHPPAGGFQNGAWYWDPAAGKARQYWNGGFGAPGAINNPNQQGYGTAAGSNGTALPAPSNPLQQVNQVIQDSFQKLQDEVVQRFGQYQSGKPFSVDEVLTAKTKEAQEQVDPYYKQMLGDYLTGVQQKMDRSTADTRDLLGELTASDNTYQQGATNSQNENINQAQQGFADNGLNGSGDALRAEGQIKQDTGTNLADYMRKSAYQRNQAVNANTRNLQDLATGSKNFQTQLGQEQYTAEQTRASDLTKEAGQQYIQGFQQTLPTQLQSASGFDMLKSLGIYN